MMTSSKPYLIRAIYEWIADNNYTPYITVNTNIQNVTVPKQYIKNNTITLDISSTSTKQLLIDNEVITCKARFAGIVHDLYVPIASVIAIFAKENNHGMAFPNEEDATIASEPPKPNKQSLKIIKGGKD